MIVVYCDNRGYVLLGKAREIADETGDRVCAITDEQAARSSDELIALGADEVVNFRLSKGGWVAAISSFVTKEPGIRMILFPSGEKSSCIMGAVYAMISEKVSGLFVDADSLSGGEAAKKLEGFALIQRVQPKADGKVSLISIKLSAVPEPFEDISRYGKTRIFEGQSEENVPTIALESRSSALTPIVLVGREVSEQTAKLASVIAEKYHGTKEVVSGRIEVVYGPCIAIEVSSKLRELPMFKGELISISSKRFPINSVSELSVITPEPEKILEKL
jgi:hypothetical protein